MGKRLGLIAGSVALAVLLIIIFTVIETYSGLAASREAVDQLAGNIQIELQQQSDLIPNLINAVQGYATHEEGIYTSLDNARSRIMKAGSVEQMAEADAELANALSRLLVVVESYPELRTDQQFLALQDQLEGAENRLKTSCAKYNEAVRIYNTKRQRFPSSVFANAFNFDKADYFEVTPGAEAVQGMSY